MTYIHGDRYHQLHRALREALQHVPRRGRVVYELDFQKETITSAPAHDLAGEIHRLLQIYDDEIAQEKAEEDAKKLLCDYCGGVGELEGMGHRCECSDCKGTGLKP